jgi:hypothetical protein
MTKYRYKERTSTWKLAIYAFSIAAIVTLGTVLIYEGIQSNVTVTGSGNLVTREPSLSGFSAVQVEGGFRVNVTYSSSYSINVTADDNVIDYVLVEKTDETIRIGLRSGSYTQVTLRASIAMPTVTGVTLSGGTTGSLSGFSGQNSTTVSLSGGSTLGIHQLSVSECNFDLSGGSRVDGAISGVSDARFDMTGGSTATLEGDATNMIINSSAGSSLNLFTLSAHNANVTISDGGTARLRLDGVLNANLSDGSRILYIGHPTMGNIVLSDGSTIGEG